MSAVNGLYLFQLKYEITTKLNILLKMKVLTHPTVVSQKYQMIEKTTSGKKGATKSEK